MELDISFDEKVSTQTTRRWLPTDFNPRRLTPKEKVDAIINADKVENFGDVLGAIKGGVYSTERKTLNNLSTGAGLEPTVYRALQPYRVAISPPGA